MVKCHIDTKAGFSLILQNRSIKMSSFKEILPLRKHEMFFLRMKVIDGLELIKYNWRKSLFADHIWRKPDYNLYLFKQNG